MTIGTSPARWKSKTVSSGSMAPEIDGVLAFTDFGIESLIEFIKMYKDDPTLLKRYDPQQ